MTIRPTKQGASEPGAVERTPRSERRPAEHERSPGGPAEFPVGDIYVREQRTPPRQSQRGLQRFFTPIAPFNDFPNTARARGKLQLIYDRSPTLQGIPGPVLRDDRQLLLWLATRRDRIAVEYQHAVHILEEDEFTFPKAETYFKLRTLIKALKATDAIDKDRHLEEEAEKLQAYLEHRTAFEPFVVTRKRIGHDILEGVSRRRFPYFSEIELRDILMWGHTLKANPSASHRSLYSGEEIASLVLNRPPAMLPTALAYQLHTACEFSQVDAAYARRIAVEALVSILDEYTIRERAGVHLDPETMTSLTQIERLLEWNRDALKEEVATPEPVANGQEEEAYDAAEAAFFTTPAFAHAWKQSDPFRMNLQERGLSIIEELSSEHETGSFRAHSKVLEGPTDNWPLIQMIDMDMSLLGDRIDDLEKKAMRLEQLIPSIEQMDKVSLEHLDAYINLLFSAYLDILQDFKKHGWVRDWTAEDTGNATALEELHRTYGALQEHLHAANDILFRARVEVKNYVHLLAEIEAKKLSAMRHINALRWTITEHQKLGIELDNLEQLCKAIEEEIARGIEPLRIPHFQKRLGPVAQEHIPEYRDIVVKLQKQFNGLLDESASTHEVFASLTAAIGQLPPLTQAEHQTTCDILDLQIATARAEQRAIARTSARITTYHNRIKRAITLLAQLDSTEDHAHPGLKKCSIKKGGGGEHGGAPQIPPVPSAASGGIPPAGNIASASPLQRPYHLKPMEIVVQLPGHGSTLIADISASALLGKPWHDMPLMTMTLPGGNFFPLPTQPSPLFLPPLS